MDDAQAVQVNKPRCALQRYRNDGVQGEACGASLFNTPHCPHAEYNVAQCHQRRISAPPNLRSDVPAQAAVPTQLHYYARLPSHIAGVVNLNHVRMSMLS